jgi:hypothetical protein
MRLVTAVVDVRNPMQARANGRGAGIDADESCMTLSFFEFYNLADRFEFPDDRNYCPAFSKMNGI